MREDVQAMIDALNEFKTTYDTDVDIDSMVPFLESASSVSKFSDAVLKDVMELTTWVSVISRYIEKLVEKYVEHIKNPSEFFDDVLAISLKSLTCAQATANSVMLSKEIGVDLTRAQYTALKVIITPNIKGLDQTFSDTGVSTLLKRANKAKARLKEQGYV